MNNGSFWAPYAKELVTRYRLIVVDLRAHGRSTSATVLMGATLPAVSRWIEMGAQDN